MKTLHLLTVALIAMIVASCSSKPTIDYMPAKAEGDSDWGLVDANGEFLFTDEFSNRPSPAVNGFFFVEEGKGLTVYRAEKSPKIVGNLTDLHECGFYNDGVMPVVHKGEHITFVDNKGKTKFILDNVDGVNVKEAINMFINGRCSFSTSDNMWGAIDNNGNVVIKPVYEQPLVFIEDKVLAKNKETGEVVIIDRDCNVKNVISDLPDDAELRFGGFIDGISLVHEGRGDDDPWCIVKDNGEVVKLNVSASYIIDWNKDYIVYRVGSGYGIITVDGENVVRPKYDDIELLANGMFIGIRNVKGYTINPDGDAESIGAYVFPAIRDPYPLSHVFDFRFEMVSEKDDIYALRSYVGERIGKKMGAYNNDVNLSFIRSDYYDYEGVTEEFMSMFDAQGLKGYPFGSQMSVYASRTSYSKEWFKGDRSISVTIEEANEYFHVPSATIYSNNYIVYDAVGLDYYDWQFNPSATLNAFKLTVSLPDDTHTEELIEHFAKALENRYGVNIQTGGSGMNTLSRDGYGSITLEVNDYGWSGSVEAAAEVVEEVVAADSCVVCEDDVAVAK